MTTRIQDQGGESKPLGKSVANLFHRLDIGRLGAVKQGKPKAVIRTSEKDLKKAFATGRSKDLDHWTPKRIERHTSGSDVFFYASDARRHSGLIMIDVDSDDLDEAMEFCFFLKKSFFAGLHFEPSTGWKGGHAYLVVDWGVIPRAEVMQRLKRFEAWLDALARQEGFALKQVEIAGTPTEVFFTGRKIDTVKFGQMAKVPRQIEACEKTTRLKLRDIDRIVKENPIEREFIRRKKRGSVRGTHITREMVEKHLPYAEDFITDFAPKAKGNARNITAEHVASFFALAEFFAENPNGDGTNPTARMKALWDRCYDDGTIRVKHVPAIIAAIRNAVSDANLIDWTDHRFEPAALIQPHVPREERVKGVAMKWSIDRRAVADYHDSIDAIKKTVAPSEGTLFPQTPLSQAREASISIVPIVAGRQAFTPSGLASGRGGDLGDSRSPSAARHPGLRPIRAFGLISFEPPPDTKALAA